MNSSLPLRHRSKVQQNEGVWIKSRHQNPISSPEAEKRRHKKIMMVCLLAVTCITMGFSINFKLIHYVTAYSTKSRHESNLNIQSQRSLSHISLATTGRCAINFFGLPRAFESLVLPSIKKKCD
jgi:hypothetical protein